MDGVSCLLGLCQLDWHGEAKSELQLIVETSDGLEPHLICATLWSNVLKSYGCVLSNFARLTGLRAVIAEPAGRLPRGEVSLAGLSTGC